MTGHVRATRAVLAALLVGVASVFVSATPGHADSGHDVGPDREPPSLVVGAVGPTGGGWAQAAGSEGSATGPGGQRLTVTPHRGLDPAGVTVRVVGEGYDRSVGIYVAMCVDRGAGVAPSPCFGGVDTTGGSRSTVWISDNPPPYAVGLTKPFGPGGTFDVEIQVAARQDDDAGNPILDCLDGVTRCVVATRADHTRPTDRSADVKVPVAFGGDGGGGAEPPPEPPPTPEPAVTLDRRVVAAGGTLVVSGSGFLPGEQVELVLHSDPTWLATPVADAAGAFAETVTVPVDTPPGEHHVAARGVTSGRTARSGTFEVVAPRLDTTTTTAAVPDGVEALAVDGVPVPPPAVTGTASPSTGTLPATGLREDLARLGLVLVAGGVVLVALSRIGAPWRRSSSEEAPVPTGPPG